MNSREQLIDHFMSQKGWAPSCRRPLAGDASFRHYHRLQDGPRQAILMDAPPPKEDVRPFVRMARHLIGLGYSAPGLLAVDEVNGLLLLEDFGDHTFSRLLDGGTAPEALYGLAIDLLADLHIRGPKAWPEGLAPYDDARLMTEARLLIEWYLPEVTGQPLSPAAGAEYEDLWQALWPMARGVPDSLVLRDFHVDNLMRLSNRTGLAACGLLDFQDAVVGPLTYDLMSLLEDARRDLDRGLVARMQSRYLAAMPGLDPQAFYDSWTVLAAQRHAKVIGIFTRLHRRDGKPVYLQHIPRVWRLFEAALAHPRLTALRRWLDHHFPPHSRP
ncbi:MAG TPA: phosphotransferase [Rhodospirillaceae bacterium]|nr:phosphotransferase [Rhodospirillaceae bacterium]